jgi:predicted branched-subunit amino acid permease
MSIDSSDKAAGPPWTLAGFNLGMRLTLPVVPGMIAFGLAVGATAARKGFGFIDNLVMNLFVYAGMSQLVALEAWPERITFGALAALAVLMITINARMLLMSAALYPWLGASPPARIYPTLHFLADPSWLVTMRYRAEGGSDAGVFLGSNVLLAIAWIAAACVGHIGGTLIADPRRYGVDLVMPILDRRRRGCGRSSSARGRMVVHRCRRARRQHGRRFPQ